MTCPVCSGAGIDFSRSDAGTRHPCPRCEGTGDQPRHPTEHAVLLPPDLARPGTADSDVVDYYEAVIAHDGKVRTGPIRIESRHHAPTGRTIYHAIAAVK